MSYDTRLADRLRATLADLAPCNEITMMGALVFTVGGHMCCGVTGDALMIRVGSAARDAALSHPHARPMTVGGGRQPKGFVLVDPLGFADDAAFAWWVRQGLDFVGTLSPNRERQARQIN